MLVQLAESEPAVATEADLHARFRAMTRLPGAPPDWIPAASIATAGAINGWSEADFISAIRTGVDKTGHKIAAEMPTFRYSGMTDDELKAIWQFISTAPPKAYGNR